ncbi:MAG TPA: L-2-hydroxyglutarate oxidase [Acidimicrobiales bacterium]|nr:L-2-hydroxyglutarate oxidase [Acidimicrobiales bacterium]
MTAARYGVVGAGILGLAVAHKLQAALPDAAVTVLDKEDAVARHQTGHNSGVVHAGIYYAPGSLKARLCLEGRRQLRELCDRHGLAFDECGKLVVAVTDDELEPLADLERRATANGVPGLRRVAGPEMREIEPHVAGVAALHSPATAIVDFVAVSEALAADVTAAGGEVRLRWSVTGVERRGAETVLRSPAGDLAFDRVVICAGLQSDRVARLAGDDPEPRIVPFRGEYYRLTGSRTHLVRGLVYPVPDPAYPFLGVHFTRRVGGGVDVGPNAVLALAREGYRRRDARLGDVADIVANPGFWRLARRHWRAGAAELMTSLSREAYARRARRYVPELTARDLRPAPAGVRAQALARDGSLVDDFVLGGRDGAVSVRNAPSPAATSALAIADEIVRRLT